MSTVQATNRAAFLRLYDAIGTGDAELISETIDEVAKPDVALHTQLPVEETGAAGLKQGLAMLRRAFPDLRLSVEDVIAEGDRVVGRTAVTGTHEGEHMGLAPTGREFAIDEIMIFRFESGRIAEIWGVVDVFSQMRQLGAIAA